MYCLAEQNSHFQSQLLVQPPWLFFCPICHNYLFTRCHPRTLDKTIKSRTKSGFADVISLSWLLLGICGCFHLPESFALQNLMSEKDSMSYGVPPCGFLSWDPIRHPKFGVNPSSPYGKAKSRSFELVTCVRVCSRVQQALGHVTLG